MRRFEPNFIMKTTALIKSSLALLMVLMPYAFRGQEIRKLDDETGKYEGEVKSDGTVDYYILKYSNLNIDYPLDRFDTWEDMVKTLVKASKKKHG